MKIVGFTDDGRRITRSLGIEVTETTEERDERREAEAYDAVRDAGPELLQALTGVLAVLAQIEKYFHEMHEKGFEPDEQQAIDYALAIVRKLNPDYGKETANTSSGDTLA